MSDELKVPKRRAQVELLLPGGGARQVQLFLAEFAPTHSGPERVSDLLNGGADFVPALDLATDSMTFVSRHGIAAARTAQQWEYGDEVVGTTTHELEIALADGTQLRGTVAYVLPSEHSRLLDYLNSAPPFLRLAEGDRVALVNKRHIARVAKLK